MQVDLLAPKKVQECSQGYTIIGLFLREWRHFLMIRLLSVFSKQTSGGAMIDMMSDVMDTVRLSAIFSNIAAIRLEDMVRRAKKISQG
jgi:hypothetical protein